MARMSVRGGWRCGVLAASLVLASAQGAAAQNKDQSWISAFGGRFSDTELMQALRNRLGGLYQNLQVVVASCQSEGFAREGARLLNGDYSVAASREFWRDESYRFSKEEVVNDKTGLQVGANPAEYMHGWYAQYFRGIQGDGNRTAQQLQQFAVANDYRGPNNGSRIEGNAAGLAAKIRDGAGGSRAGMWHTFGREGQIKTVDQVLKDRGYTNETIHWALGDRGGQNFDGVPIDQDGDRASMFGEGGIIESMRTYLQGDEGRRKALIVLRAHGSTAKREAEKKPDAQPMRPKQGKQYTPGSGMSLEIGADEDLFITSFFEGFRTDDPELEAFEGDRPMFYLTTSEEQYAGPVTVLCDGVDIGGFSMLGLPDGGQYRFDLSDSAWGALFSAGVLDDRTLSFTFEFAAGSFRVATEWDQDLSDLSNFGVGIVGPGIIGIPAPAGLGLLGLGVLAASRRRRA